MVFSDTSTKTGLIQDCEQTLYGDDAFGVISGDTNKLYVFTNLLNRALDEVVSLIISTDTRWQWDDTNYTDYPIATTSLVSGQRDYTLSVSHLKILRVKAKDAAGNWVILKPIDQADRPSALEETYNTNATPIYYDKLANSIFLYPTPSYDATAGLKVEYQREPSYFAYTDTTKEPGFAEIYHPLVSKIAVHTYATDRLMSNADRLGIKVKEMKAELENFISKRDKDDRSQLKAKTRSSR